MIIELKIKKGSKVTREKVEVEADVIMEILDVKYAAEIYKELDKKKLR